MEWSSAGSLRDGLFSAEANMLSSSWWSPPSEQQSTWAPRRRVFLEFRDALCSELRRVLLAAAERYRTEFRWAGVGERLESKQGSWFCGGVCVWCVVRCARASLEGVYEGDVESAIRAVTSSVEEWAGKTADRLERE